MGGLAEATNRETDPAVKSNIQLAQVMTVISWCTYPVVYLFPMLGITASHAVVGIQVGYCCSDIISKCGVGPLIYQITYAKSKQERMLGSAGKMPPSGVARFFFLMRWKAAAFFFGAIFDLGPPSPHSHCSDGDKKIELHWGQFGDAFMCHVAFCFP